MTNKKEQPEAQEQAQEVKKAVAFARVLERQPDGREMAGADVKALHALLIAHKFRCGEDEKTGAYGRATVEAVRGYQAQQRLTVDGRAGKDTITKLGGEWNGK